MLTNAGFGRCTFEHSEIDYRIESLEPLLRGGWEMAQLENQPQEVQENIRRDTIQNAEEFKKDGAYVFPDVMFLGVAQKA